MGGALTGFAILIEYTICPAAISTFIAAYVHALGLFADIPSVAIIGFFFIVFVGIHLIGVGEALKIVFGITAIAMIALIAFVVGIAPHFEVANLFNIAPVVDGGTALLPFGVAGVISALPFGIWLFLAVEGVPLAAEESANPKKDMPKGIIGAILTLMVTGALVLFLTAGGAGAEFAGAAAAPLVDALNEVGEGPLATFVNYAGLAGWLLRSSRRYSAAPAKHSLFPVLAICPSSFPSRAPVKPRSLPARFGHHCLYLGCRSSRRRHPPEHGGIRCMRFLRNDEPFPHYLAQEGARHGAWLQGPGGIALTGISFALSLVAIVSTFTVDAFAAGCTLAVLAGLMVYFLCLFAKASGRQCS